MPDIKVVVDPVAGCNHVKLKIYTASDMILRKTVITTRGELSERLDLDNMSAEERLLSQIRGTVLANEGQSISVIKAAVEAATYRV